MSCRDVPLLVHALSRKHLITSTLRPAPAPIQVRTWTAQACLKRARHAASTLATAYRARFDLRTKSVVVLQAATRSKLERLRIGRMSKSARLIATMARGFLARCYRRAALRSVLVLQRHVRGLRVRRPDVLAMSWKKSCALKEEVKALQARLATELQAKQDGEKALQAQLAKLQAKLDGEKALSAAFARAVTVEPVVGTPVPSTRLISLAGAICLVEGTGSFV